MMSRTHIAVGVAAALACARPETLAEGAATVMLGAAGAKLSDIDMLWNKRPRDVGVSLLTAALAVVCLLVLDALMGTGVFLRILSWLGADWRIGAAMLAALCIPGYFAEHRSFTHSLLAMTLFSVAVYLILPAHATAFIVGYGTHLLLDLLNRKPLRLMYPFRRSWCLGLCSADGVVNGLLMWLGLAAIAGMTAWPVIQRVLR